MNIAIITGASSGLGREYALAACRMHPEIECFWLIARREKRLHEVGHSLSGKPYRALMLDLTDYQSYEELAALLQAEKPNVSLLINNSGFGKLGNVADLPYAAQGQMVDLNNRALTAVTALVLPYMQAGAAIINVASIAAFVPTPRMSVYCSTKAFVLSFSTSLREELKPRGIQSLAVCPGPMSTEFLTTANIPVGASHVFDTLPRVDPAAIAKKSLACAYRGRAVYTGKVFYKFYRLLAKLLPHNFLMKFTRT